MDSGTPLRTLWSVAMQPRNHTIDDVMATASSMPWAPSRLRPVVMGADESLWVRLPLEPNGALAPARWLVEFPMPGLDRVEMFRIEGDQLTLNEVSGDQLSVAVWPVNGRYPSFELISTRWTPVTYYFKISHDGPVSLTGVLKSTSHFMRTQLLSNLFFGTFFGAIALLILLAGEAAVSTRHPAFAAFAVYAAATALTCMSSSGLLGEWWIEGNPHLIDLLPHALALLTAAAGLVYLGLAVSLLELSRARFVTTLALAAAGAGMALAGDAAGLPLAPAAMLYVTVAALVGLALLSYAWLKGANWVLSHALALVPYGLALTYVLAEWAFHVRMPPQMFFVIALAAVLHLALSYAALNKRVKKLLEAQARMQASTTVDPLTGVANYRRLSLQMPGLLERARYNRHNAALLVVEITNLPLFRAASGQRGIEFALVRTAAAIRGAIKNIDMVSRVDDAHFVVAIEGPTTGAEASRLATHMIANGLRVSGRGMSQMPISLRIYIELVPRQDMDLEQLLSQAVRTLRTLPMEDPRRIITSAA